MSNITTTNGTFEIFNVYIPKILILICSLLNGFGNGSIIWVTIRRKSLRNPCNIFIAMTALSDFSAQGVFYPNAYYAFSGQHPPLGTCWRIIFFPVGMAGITFVSTLFVGIDRFIGIIFPIIYHKFCNSRIYVPFVGILSLIYGFIWTPWSYAFVLENENLPQYDCGFGSFIITDNIINILNNFSKLVLCLGMLVVYAIIWTYMKFRKTAITSENKIMKSLTVNTIVVALTWPTSFAIFVITGPYRDSKAVQMLYTYVLVMVNIGIAANYFIFYAFSTKYRNAFQQQLAFLLCCKSKIKSSGPVFIGGGEGHSPES